MGLFACSIHKILLNNTQQWEKDTSDRMKVSANLIFPVEQSSIKKFKNLGCMAESVENITQLITVRISYNAVIPHIFYL